MNSGPDRILHTTTGTQEVPTLHTVTDRKDRRPKDNPPRKRRRRDEAASPGLEVELTGQADEELPEPDQAVEPAGAEAPDEPHSVDYLA